MDRLKQILVCLAQPVRKIIADAALLSDDLQEIRLRTNQPLMIVYKNQEYLLNSYGRLIRQIDHAYHITMKDIQDTVQLISRYSLYAYEDDIRLGFLTLQGGHRVGLTGKVVLDNQRIKGMKYISGMNFRLAHQIKGCADSVIPFLFSSTGMYHTLIISPPGGGKTTLLRDLIRQISNGSIYYKGLNVSVVDERSEIGACYMGIAQNDLGIRTDILDHCPKSAGMRMLLRSMTPQVIAVDEIGTREELDAMEEVLHGGVKLLTTVHGNSRDDLLKKQVLCQMVQSKMIERYIVLGTGGKTGQVEAILDADGSYVYKNNRECLPD